MVIIIIYNAQPVWPIKRWLVMKFVCGIFRNLFGFESKYAHENAQNMYTALDHLNSTVSCNCMVLFSPFLAKDIDQFNYKNVDL